MSSQSDHLETTGLLESQQERSLKSSNKSNPQWRKLGMGTVLGFLVLLVATRWWMSSGTKVVYIIRHGEKIYRPSNATAYKYACLSQQGYSRAYHLSSVFGRSNQHGFRTPEALFAFDYDNGDLDCLTSQGYYRTKATLVPLAEDLGLEIDDQHGAKEDLCGLEGMCQPPKPGGSPHNFGPCCNGASAKAILKELQSSQSILVAWEHANIPFLIDALAGGNQGDPVSWPDSEFDLVVGLYFDATTLAFARIEPDHYQNFHWIGPQTSSSVDYSYGLGERPGVNR